MGEKKQKDLNNLIQVIETYQDSLVAKYCETFL